jgi:hypothetical protein
MAEIINLRRARKARERAEARAQADANAARHGLDKGQRAAIAAQAEQVRRTLDGARRDPADDPHDDNDDDGA